MNTYLSISQIKFLLYKSRYSHIRELRCIYPYLDFKTVSSYPTPLRLSTPNLIILIHSTSVSKSQLNRLQLIQNSYTRAIVKAPKFSQTTPILYSCLYTG